MPTGRRAKTLTSKVPSSDEYNFDADSPGDPDVPAGPPAELPTSANRGSKRQYEETDNFEGYGGPNSDMQSLLSTFGADISKTLDAKRKRLEAFSQASMKVSNRKVDEIWRVHNKERATLHEQYVKQLSTLIVQWENEMQKAKDTEEKLQNAYRQQQKLLQQLRVTQQQKLQAVKQLSDQFNKSVEKLDDCHQQQQSAMQGELHKEMAMLQKKMLMDSQHQELSHVRKTLQTMLAQV